MNRLLHIEWNKFFYNKGTRIFLILYFILIGLMGAVLPNIKPQMNGIEINFIEMGALNFPVIWHNIAWLIGFGKFFLAVIVINNISNEYSFGTFKQNTIDGLSRLEFFSSKLYMNLLFVFASTLLVYGIVMGLGVTFAETIEPMAGIEFLFAYFIEILAFVAMAMFLAFLLKKSTFAILIIFVLYIVELILKGLEAFFLFKPSADGKEYTYITSFLPLSSNGNIIDYPPVSLTQFLTTGKLFTSSAVQWEYLCVSILYIIVFFGLSYILIKKRDL